REHPFNCVLYKTLRLLLRINTNAVLQSRIGSLLLNFPEMPDIHADDAFFNKLQYNRKTEAYRQAMEIARLILLNYHPDVKNGQNHVLALMFDMNLLWERFVYVSLSNKKTQGVIVRQKETKNFWRFEDGRSRSMWLEPDIYIEWNGGKVVLDTKWKNLDGNKPDIQDLRQMYAYTKYFEAKKVALVYPGTSDERKGNFYKEGNIQNESGEECSLIPIDVEQNIKDWQLRIWNKIKGACKVIT
ncbi:MAG: restriction endonuclease, partial [Saprospiraceae bacterium]|nr:restriction endonuclease [Saprospiraceae bacterium]